MTAIRDVRLMSTSECVAYFEQLSLAESEAIECFESGRANRFIEKRYRLLWAMCTRNPDERPALYVLYNHRHPQVRLNVAKSTYALNPERAREIMREIVDSKMFPWAGDAGMNLAFLDDGMSALPKDPELGRIKR